MEQKKSLTLNGLVIPNFLYILVSMAMIFTGAYLTNHYFDTLYPSGVTGSSNLCNISDFWGCDKATQSPLGSIAGMPTSIFGVIMGLLGLFTAFVGSSAVEKTMKSITTLNLAACVLLLAYSLIILQGLCPMCSVYYVLSFLAFLLFFKYSDAPFGFDMKVSAGFAVVIILPIIGSNIYINNIKSNNKELANSYISQFNNLKDYGDPVVESPYKIHMATEQFNDAPIRVSIFSDFQCPYCQAVAEQMPQLIKEFGENINIQYMFYPLDATCNTKMQSTGHPYACKSAYLAACDKNKFVEVHDYIFEKQMDINTTSLNKWAKKFELDIACLDNKDIHDKIQQTLNAGEQYNLKSTPTIIVNGKKLEGMIPTVHLKAILKSLIKK